ncbi:MAG TPA: ubiquitin-like domain-containing protein [Microlunatus sp.]
MRKIIPAVAASAAALAVAGATFGYITLDKDVQLSVDGAASDVSTMANTVGEVLQSRGIELGEHDVVAPAPETKLVDGTRIAVQYGRQIKVTVDGKPQTYWTTATNVDQALASLDIKSSGAQLSTSRSAAIGRNGLSFNLATLKTITVDHAGTKRRIKTTAQTVGAALAVAKIKVDADDKVSVNEATRLADGARFSVTRVDVTTVTKKKKVDHTTRYQDSDELDRGDTKVETEGKAGVRTITYTEVRHNGKLQSREKTKSKISKAPRTEVVLRGTKESEPEPEPQNDSSDDSSNGNSGSSNDSNDSNNSNEGNSSTPASGTVWDRLAQCESGGNWQINTGNGYYGGLQFAGQTWRAYGGSGMAHNASRGEQIRIAKKVLADVGWQAWPACSSKLGLR